MSWPHSAPGFDLTPSQRAENLAWLEAERPLRLKALQDLLQDLGVVLPPPDTPNLDAERLSSQIDALAKQRFARIAPFEAGCAPEWRKTPVTGLALAGRSLAVDLGVYFGECATHAKEPFVWRIGESRYRPANMPTTAGEVVISKLSTIGAKPAHVDLDVIAWSVFAVWDIVRQRRQRAFWKPNSFFYLEHLLSNRY